MLRDIPVKDVEEVEKVTTYGNKIWNDATDNRNKSLVSMNEDTFMKLKPQLEHSGINYFAYTKDKKTIMAVNDKDLNWLKQISGTEHMPTRKSDVEHIPPQKNIIGNAEYRYIPDKQYISTDSDTALKLAEIMMSRNIQFSGRVYPNGKATLTVSGADLLHVQAIQQSIVDMRKQFAKETKADEVIGNKSYRDIRQRQYYYSKLTPEQYKKVQLYLDTNAQYSGLIRNNKIIFTVEKEDSTVFHRALENAQREAQITQMLKDNGIDDYRLEKLSAVIHRFSVEDIHEHLDNFFTPQLTEHQFDKMLSLFNDYLAQSLSERYGEYSGLNAILDFKNEMDRAAELDEYFSEHTFSDEQKSVISEMFAQDTSKKNMETIDETFTPDEIREYYAILHNQLDSGDAAEFLASRNQPKLTDKEQAFLDGDIVPFMAKSVLAWDEIESIGYRMFEDGYNDKYAPHDKAVYGNGLKETELSDLVHRMNDGEDIRKELATALLGNQHTFTTTQSNKFSVEYGDMDVKAHYENAQRAISYDELGDAFLSLIRNEHDDIVKDRTVQDLHDMLTDIDDEKAESLISAFDGNAIHDWKTNEVAQRKIKSALYDILGDDKETETAYSSIAEMKYNFKTQQTDEKSSIHFGLFGNGITAYDVSRTDKNTNDYVTVAHISPEGVLNLYDDTVSPKDMEIIKSEAHFQREKFMAEWNMLDTTAQLEKLYDRADTETMLNMSKENLSADEKISKYMPFVFFGEGERPEQKKEQSKPTVGDLSVGDVILYEGKRREVEKLDKDGLDEIKDTALSLGATCTLIASGLVVDTYENHKEKLLSSAYELGILAEIGGAEHTADKSIEDDVPLFADADVIDEIEKSEKASDNRPFYEMSDVKGEQLSFFGDSVPLSTQKQEFAEGLFAGNINRFTALKDEIMRGTGFENGKFRVKDYYDEKKPTNKEFANFLKDAYGTGGHSGNDEISFVDHDSKGLFFTLANDEKFKFTWSDVAEMTSAIIDKGEYITQEDIDRRIRNEKSNDNQDIHADKTEVPDAVIETKQESSMDAVQVGDKFKNLHTGEVSEVIALTGALPYITDDCTVQRETGGFVITENIPYSKILDSNLYEHIDKYGLSVNEKPKASEKPDMSAKTNADRKDAHSNKGDWFVHTSVNNAGIEIGSIGRMKDTSLGISGKNMEYCSGLFTADNEQGFNIEFANSLAEQLNEKNITTIKSSTEFVDSEIALRDDFSDITLNADSTDKTDSFTITDDSLGSGGAKTKFKNNIAAIETLRKIENDNLNLASDMFKPRSATADEQEILSKYVGWGGIPQAFDKDNPSWKKEYAQLKELMTDSEYTSARASVLDAFFTSPTVIDGIYEALSNFGFEGGNVLEPAMGVGNFFGRMPEEMKADSKLYGVEIDSISGRIAKQLYPDADIAIKGFEQNNFQDGCFDVAVGNVPFGELGFKDDKHGTTKLHDYFFAETLDKVKDGGIVAFVTSSGTLDKRDESTRKMLSEKADLIGAVRLPGGKDGAFKENAGTQVTTDIIFLQKKGDDIPKRENALNWLSLGVTEDGLPINNYFAENPDMVLGKVIEGNQLYGSGTMVIAEEGANLKEQIHTAVSKLTASISDEKAKDVYAKTAEGKTIEIPSNLRNYSFFEQDNNIYFKTNHAVCHCRYDTKNSQFKRAKAFIQLRDLTRDLLDAQELDKPDDVIKGLQAQLNTAYDDFYKRYGLIHSQTNKRYFSDDVSYNLVAGLEKKYEKTELKEKSDIFFKRTIQPPKAVEHVETAMEALTLSAAERAGVDFAYMTKLTGMIEDELKHDLQDEIYRIPHSENAYQTASEYLSGDIREKLRIAEEIAEYDADFNVNVNALKNAMPTPLKAGDIDVKIGATWIDPKYYEQFMYETFQTPREHRADVSHPIWQRPKLITAEYSEHSGTWHIDNKNYDKSVIAMQQYGSKHMSAYEIMEHLLNLKEPKIYKTIEVPDGMGDVKEKRVVDIDATRVVQKKADKVRADFKKWIFRDQSRREDIVQKYNELFNSTRPREFDGSALSFPLMNSDITLHEHQKNAIAHSMFGGNTLFAHCVGAGKTFEMIATAMESKRLGLCTKSLFAVPNHLTEQIGDDFQKLYPSANILVATKKDFQKENRQQLFAKIATGNFDAVIIGHSQLGMIPMSKERQESEIQSQIDDILLGIEELKKSEGSKFQIKAMERTKKSLDKQLDKLNKNHDDTITFEQLGVDKLFVDEAHEFKNLFCPTKLNNISGISNSASQKALDLYLKCRYLDEKTGGKGIVFATGTPLSNSVTELHTMMRYLEYDYLKSKGLQHFDNWVTVFGEQKTDWELAPAGNKFKERTRIANYTGLPELMSMFKQIADIRTSDTLKLDVPHCDYKIVNVEATPFQKELVDELSERADAINSGNVDPSIDNMLKITSDGRKLGLDPRLIDPSFEDNPNTKLNQCVDNVTRIHAETSQDKLAQIIFCDLGVPQKNATDPEKIDDGNASDEKSSAERDSLEEECDFCVYDDIKAKLISKGIPENEIAYIHSAKTEKQKSELFDKVRSGEVRVLLGSTAKMGTGTNVQRKLVAVHDLDIPWRPADLEQRAGRIIRQGNENKNVEIYRYVTKGTFDAYSYQTLENKQKFISQIMTSKEPARKCADVDQQALSYSEIKALCTGDERIKEKLMLDNDVKELKALEAEHHNTVYEMEDKIKAFPEREERLNTALENLRSDREHLRKLPIDEETKLPVFKITIGDVEYTDKKEAAKAFEDAVLAIKTADTSVKIGEFQNFTLSVTMNSPAMGGGVSATIKGAYPHSTKLIESFAHNLRRLEGSLYNIDRKIGNVNTELSKLRVDYAEAQKIVSEPFPQADELTTKESRLKTLTEELNQAAIEAKKNAPKKEKTCYFERAKLKKEAMRISQKKSDKSKERSTKLEME